VTSATITARGTAALDETQQRRGTAASPTCGYAPAMPSSANTSTPTLLHRRQSSHHLETAALGVEEPRPARLALVDADPPSLSYRQIVGD
jgi:hypothetical protein